MRLTFKILALAVLLLTFGSTVVRAGELAESQEFQLENWYVLDSTDGPVTLHRLRLDSKKDRFTKSAVFRPHNQEFLETIGIQLEYTNEADRKWKARVSVRWLDEEGRVIDGFSGNETIDKRSARKIVAMSVSTLKYGLERAATLEIKIDYEP